MKTHENPISMCHVVAEIVVLIVIYTHICRLHAVNKIAINMINKMLLDDVISINRAYKVTKQIPNLTVIDWCRVVHVMIRFTMVLTMAAIFNLSNPHKVSHNSQLHTSR